MKKKWIRIASMLPLLAAFSAAAGDHGIVRAPSGIVNTLHPLHAECVIFTNLSLPPRVFSWTFAIPWPYDARARANTVRQINQRCEWISQGKLWKVFI